MTTIATRGDGILAADSQCTWGDTKSRVTKLHRLPCGGVVGGAGAFPEIMRYVRWMQAGGKGKAPKINNADLLVAYGDGRTGTICGGIFTEAVGPQAVGSGMQGAMVAMAMGANAEEAVRAVAEVDPSTSGPFQVMVIEPPKRWKRQK